MNPGFPMDSLFVRIITMHPPSKFQSTSATSCPLKSWEQAAKVQLEKNLAAQEAEGRGNSGCGGNSGCEGRGNSECLCPRSGDLHPICGSFNGHNWEKMANSKIGIWIGNKSDDILELEVCHGMSHFETRPLFGGSMSFPTPRASREGGRPAWGLLGRIKRSVTCVLPRTNDGAETIQYPSPGPFSRWAGGGWDWGHGLWLIEWMVNDRMVDGFCLDPWY